MAVHEMEILDATGHTTKRWDESNEAEMQVVQRLFADLTTKGYKAFSVNKVAGRNEIATKSMKAFDPEAEKMLLVPPIQAG